MNNIIAKEWEEFKSKCVPLDAGPQQLVETKLASYSGMVSLTSILAQALMSSNKTPSEILSSLHIEIAEEMNSMLRKKFQELGLEPPSMAS